MTELKKHPIYAQLNICFLVPASFLAPYLYQFSGVLHVTQFFGAIWDKFALNLVIF